MSAVNSPTSPTGPGRSDTIATRTSTMSDDEGVGNEDTSEVTRLFTERLKAWKHAVGYLEDYVVASEKLYKDNSKDYEKILKTVNNPLKEGEHFDQQLGGVAGMFDNIRTNTQGIANANHETAKALKGQVVPVFERLMADIKHKTKELSKGAGKGSKVVDKARKSSQKQIELLGQHTASSEITGGKISAADDPYVLHRGVYHRLNRQIQEENNNRQDLISVQNSFAQFEANIIQAIQHGLGQFNMIITKQVDLTKNMYGDMVAVTQRVPLDFEWNGFLRHNEGVLIDPQAAPRTMDGMTFPNQGHQSTAPLIAGSLERKGKILKKFDSGYWVVSPAKFLHEFKTDDNYAREPTPETSLYLPDCVVGALVGEKFAVKGKDVSKGKLGATISMNHEYQLRAHTAADAAKWYEVIRMSAGQVTNELPEASTPSSPVVARSDTQKFGAAEPAAAAGATEAAPAYQAAPGQAAPAQAVPPQAAPAQAAYSETLPAQAAPMAAQQGLPAHTAQTGEVAQPGQLSQPPMQQQGLTHNPVGDQKLANPAGAQQGVAAVDQAPAPVGRTTAFSENL